MTNKGRLHALTITSIFIVISLDGIASDIDCSQPRSEMEIQHCFQVEFKKADEKLNQVYQKLRKVTRDMGDAKASDSPQENALIAAQRQWINYRDKNCNFHHSLMYRGSGANTLFLQCKNRMTFQRAAELEGLVEAWGGMGYGQQ